MSLSAHPQRDFHAKDPFVLQVRPERIEEYKQRHRSVWPEMKQALEETGWNNYSLFLRSDGLLIGCLETEDVARACSRMAGLEGNARRQSQMETFFVQPHGLFPDEAITPLEEVFHVF